MTGLMGWQRNRKKQRHHRRGGKSVHSDQEPRSYSRNGRGGGRRKYQHAERVAREIDEKVPAPGGDRVIVPTAAGPEIPPVVAQEPQTGVAADNSAIGAGGDPPMPNTALLESQSQVVPDTRLLRRAVRDKRFKTPKELTEGVLRKLGHQALGLPWRNPVTGEEEKSGQYTPAQLKAAADTLIGVERMNQHDEHHDDRQEYDAKRLEYYDRALALRAKMPIPLMGAHMHRDADGSTDVSVMVYVPDNGRDPDGIEPVDMPPELLE